MQGEQASMMAQFTSGWLAAATLCQRELVRFLRQRNRVFGALGQPVIFWFLFSEGFRGAGSAGLDYAFFFPGVLVMILLFTAIFATISIIEDRREGFLQGVLVAPLPRWSMVLGKVLGGTLLALLQACLFLLLGWLTIGLELTLLRLVAVVGLMALIGFGLTSLGFIIAWRMDSTQGFHAVMSVLLMPMWLLSGAFFPEGAGWLGLVVRLNPLTYGVSALRQLLDSSVVVTPSAPVCWTVTVLFGAVMFGLACRMARRTARGDLL